jgi:hypothetical protein
MTHAILSPSSASRWLACTPSARQELKYPESSSEFADEGVLAHKLGELMILHKTGEMLDRDFKAALIPIEANKHYNTEMWGYCTDYAEFVIEHFNAARATTPDARLFLERKLDVSAYVPDAWGTGDAGIVSQPKLSIIDLKYGKGVKVDSNQNKQAMIYALGWLNDFEHLYDIQMVEIIIYQPRISSASPSSHFEISVNDLKAWADAELRPRALMAFNGKGDYQPGEHCRFCKAKVHCKALKDFNMDLAKVAFANVSMVKEDLIDPNHLTPADTAKVLDMAPLFINWIDAVKEYALAEANKGTKWPGFKLVEGRANRVIPFPDEAAQILVKNNFKIAEIYNTKLKGIGDLEKLVGKKDLNTLLFNHIVKPAGAPVLVPATDPRPELNSLDKTKQAFSNIQNDEL